jgi:hypothetical protein
MSCFCGCRGRVVARHHCLTAQEIRRADCARGRGARALPPLKELLADERNLVPVAFTCHGSHHARSQPYELWMLPNSVFEFTAEVLGSDRAYNWLGRHYRGEDARLDALLGAVAA